MTGARRAMLVFGTRPEAIKVAPVALALRQDGDIRPIVTVTAQHRVMLDQVLDLFGIVPDHDLDLFEPGQTLEQVTTRALLGLERALSEDRPDLVVVQGDTTTTFAAALAAFYAGIPVVHMEAGLRTADIRNPFPEEMNRRLTSQLSSLHLAATPWARRNLLNEGISPDHVVVTGNTVIDALHIAGRMETSLRDTDLAFLEDDDRPVVLVTAHRRESWGAGMVSIGRALATVAAAAADVVVVFPIHRNPIVRDAIAPQVEGLSNVVLTEPLPYGAFTRLLHRAHLVLTDSGGIQEEAPSIGKPVLVMRDTTERPEAVEAGTARLVGTDADRVAGAVLELLRDADAYRQMATAINPYGDGRASERTIGALRNFLFGEPRVADFAPV